MFNATFKPVALSKRRCVELFALGFLIVTTCYQYGLITMEAWLSPLGLQGDGLFSLFIAESFLQNFGSVYSDQLPNMGILTERYPIPEKLPYLIYSILINLSGIPVATNIMVVLIHVVSGISFYLCSRYLKFDYFFGLLMAIAFALTPYIFTRGLGHFVVACVWLVPWQVAVVTNLYQHISNSSLDLDWRLIICVALLGATFSPYHSFATILFITFFFLVCVFGRNFSLATKLLGLIAMFFLVFLLLNWEYTFSVINGTTQTLRNLPALEVYGLKLPELFLPVAHAKIPVFGLISQKIYYSISFVRGEVWGPYLGFIGIFCLAFLGLKYLRDFSRSQISRCAYVFQVVSIGLFSLIGGINLLIGVFGFQFLRATNRYAVWILVLSMFAVLSQSIKWRDQNWKILFSLVILFLSLIWIDLPHPYSPEVRNQTLQKYNSDKAFFEDLVGLNPPGMIAIFPKFVFPENGPIESVGDYSPLLVTLINSKLTTDLGMTRFDRPPELADYQGELLAAMTAKPEQPKLIFKHGYDDNFLRSIKHTFVRSCTNQIENDQFIYIEQNSSCLTDFQSDHLKMSWAVVREMLAVRNHFCQAHNSIPECFAGESLSLQKSNLPAWVWEAFRPNIVIGLDPMDGGSSKLLLTNFSAYGIGIELVQDSNGLHLKCADKLKAERFLSTLALTPNEPIEIQVSRSDDAIEVSAGGRAMSCSYTNFLLGEIQFGAKGVGIRMDWDKQ